MVLLTIIGCCGSLLLNGYGNQLDAHKDRFCLQINLWGSY